jgi:hypothetical protein
MLITPTKSYNYCIPNLYAYIDKPSLDYKFDSLKLRLLVAQTTGFYKKIKSSVAAVRQGHSCLCSWKQLTESEVLTKSGQFAI